ncbi:hypothetical protein RRG08_056939 [Elysia crispata]|uniref:Endonuclease/exonuclease/phosphatase domain-containing protein n=1 Tax=Elysia crispata TaxID=231223 RepID=A0AAE1DAM0_9GAST|nr:hypothetical protein RRG08_056939 [Elysia crispata]
MRSKIATQEIKGKQGVTSTETKRRKRGKKGGIRARYRCTAFRPPLLAIVTDGFRVFRSDLTPDSGKTRGGGVCAYINSKLCNNNNIHVIDRTCTPYIEVLSLSIRPYYLPREFPKINLNVVYIPPQVNARQAEDHITSLVHDQLNKSPDSIVLITVDFNHCTLGTSLPTLHQYVTCPTRNNKTLDVCYGNVEDGYKSSALPPLGDSAHSMVHLIPKYKSILKSCKPVKTIVTSETHQNIKDLCGCLECTDWGVFLE